MRLYRMGGGVGKIEAFVVALLIGVIGMFLLVSAGWGGSVNSLPVLQEDPHAGQPSHCANAKDVPAAHKCECKKEPNEDGNGCDIEDKKCRVYCRKDHCHCFHPACDS